VGKKKQLYVLLAMVDCYSITISFDLRISKGVDDIFAFVINFLGVDWQLKTYFNWVV